MERKTLSDQELAKIIGHRIRVIRITKRLTQKELADQLGFSSQFLSKIETGKKIISTEKLVLLCYIMQVPLKFFDPYQPDPEKILLD